MEMVPKKQRIFYTIGLACLAGFILWWGFAAPLIPVFIGVLGAVAWIGWRDNRKP